METIHGLGTNGPAIVGTGCAFTVLAVLAVGLRIGSKRIAHSRLAIDDWVLVFALLLYFTAEVLVIRSDILGRQASSPDDSLYQDYLKYVYIYSIFYFIVIALVQISILLFYRRIFLLSSFRWTSAILIALCVCSCMAAMVIEIGYPGHPIGYYFPGSSNTTFNVDYLKFWLAMAIVEIFLEITILVLPVREVYQLQLSRKKKLLCSLVFALGGFVIITGIVRIAKVYHPGETDFDLTQGDIWLNVHLGTAIICACLPTYRPLISRHSWSKMHSKRSGHSSKTSDNTHTLPSRHTVAHLGDYNELMAGLPMGQQPNSQGNFAEARRSESTDGTRGEWQHESPVKAGEAIRVKQTVDVV